MENKSFRGLQVMRLIDRIDHQKVRGDVEEKQLAVALPKSAKNLIDLVLDATGHDMIYKECCRREPKLKKDVSFGLFCEHYVAAKLALGCVYWVGCCSSHKISDKDQKNLFFREVMNLFETPKSLGNATRFSESLYASNANTEASPVLGVLVHFFHQLKLDVMTNSGSSEPVMNSAFQFMMEVFEALKTVFESQFDEVIYSNDDFFV